MTRSFHIHAVPESGPLHFCHLFRSEKMIGTLITGRVREPKDEILLRTASTQRLHFPAITLPLML
jgi:hypothetical protein